MVIFRKPKGTNNCKCIDQAQIQTKTKVNLFSTYESHYIYLQINTIQSLNYKFQADCFTMIRYKKKSNFTRKKKLKQKYTFHANLTRK